MTASNRNRPNAAAKLAAAALAAQALAQTTVDAAKEKAKIAIFSRKGDKMAAALFITVSSNARAPLFGGSIAGVKVGAFLRRPEGKRPFMSFVDERNVQVGTANVVVRSKDGVPTVKALMGCEGEAKTEVWFSLSKNVSDDMLATMGADMAKLHKGASAAV